MTDNPSAALGISRLLLQVARWINLLTGAVALIALVTSFTFEPLFLDFFTKHPSRADPSLLMTTLRLWMLLALPALAGVHVMLSRLLQMVETVGVGDPFVPENGARLTTIAWCMLGLQLFHLACGALAATMNAAGSDIDWTFSPTGWIAVALLFVLARVFEVGAHLRNDLETIV
jgi:hypothetical protein